MATLVLLTLACGLAGRGGDTVAEHTLTRLPTLTRTPLPTLTPTPLTSPASAIVQAEFTPTPAATLLNALPTLTASPTPAPAGGDISGEVVAVAGGAGANPLPAAPALDDPTPSSPPPTTTPPPLPTETPSPTPLPTAAPTVTPSPTTAVWLFSGVRVVPVQDGNGLLLYGDMVNNTGSAQQLQFVRATFYDIQGQVIPAADITDYWPTEAVPPGGQLPFELAVTGVPSPANFDLSVEAVPSDRTPLQDFEFLDLNQSDEGGNYCLSGSLRDQGNEPQEYLVIVAILYDAQNNVVNFGDYYESDPGEEIDENALDFQLCVDPLGQDVARHELRAWGL